jgi:hypothetical protein
MKKFPELSDFQVALLRVQKSTGIILDDKFDPDVSPEQIRFTVFDSKELALEYAERTLSKTTKIDFLIYDKEETIVEHLNK